MNIANKISIFRILNVPFFIACLHYSQTRPSLRLVALSIFVVAALSDAIDGYVARKSRQKSQAGAILDPLADKTLLVSAFLSLYFMKEIPFWVILIIVTRDLMITFGALVIYIIKQKFQFTPTWWGKFTTIFQMSAVISILMNLHLSKILWTLAVAFTVISGIDYLMKGFKILYAQDNNRLNH
jgi:CDP-diacylglycerol--glycerol-3-phosphate 3-phosphatidyltransferase